MFEFEKKCIKEKLFEKPELDLKSYYKRKLDDLNRLILDYLSIDLHYITGKTMLLSIYLGSMHVRHAIKLLKSLLKEIILDPVNLPYDKYAEEIEKNKSLFERYYNDCQPVYIDDSDWNCFNFQMAFGVEKDSLFPPYPINDWEFNEKIESYISKVSLQDFFEISLNNYKYLSAGIKFNLSELYCELSEIDDMMRYRLDEPLEELFKNRINDYMHSPCWLDARDELYNDIRLLTIGNDEKYVLNHIKMQYYFRLKSNRIGALYICSKRLDLFIYDLEDSTKRPTQIELNDFLKLYSQYEQISKLVDYSCKWVEKNSNLLFVNKGVDYVINTLVLYMANKIQFKSRKSYAALWQALIDLNLLNKTDAESFKDWVNDSFLKDASEDGSRGGKIKTDKSIRDAVDDMYKFQTKEGKKKLFKDLTEEEISQLKNGDNIKELYRDSILILAKAFEIDLKEENFQSYISEYPNAKEYLSDFPKDKINDYILECFRAYKDFINH